MEGTQVEEGDWVATLDRTEAELALRDLEAQVLEEETDYNSTRLDTTITLRNLRDELINLEHLLEEKKLVLGQSTYEPPATIRRAELDVERAIRDFEQARNNYAIRQRSAVETMTEAELNLQRQQRRFQAMSELLEKFIITAPEPGMVIYYREWNGEKRIAGSTIDSRDLTVAVIPDLSTLVSRAYVSELDINKVAVGQRVRIRMDAFHERTYNGQIIEVSNVGQEMPSTDAKVFEVLILVEQADNLLRPAMTTSNIIVTDLFN
ncbi:MAG: HlyD family efflux transporter periplasmic adaptor subunit, partial [Candidatus Krumholzibacteriia bacterium]